MNKKNFKLREKLFGSKDKMPMIFQYDPLQHYIRNINGIRKDGTEVAEFEMTVLDENTISPKIKYNIHDEGGIFELMKMLSILQKYEKDYLQQYQELKSSKNIQSCNFLDFIHLEKLVQQSLHQHNLIAKQ